MLDLAFVEGPVAGYDLEIEPWRDDLLVVVAAPDDPLVQRLPVPFEDLMAVPFVLREAGSGTREIARAFLELSASGP